MVLVFKLELAMVFVEIAQRKVANANAENVTLIVAQRFEILGVRRVFERGSAVNIDEPFSICSIQ